MDLVLRILKGLAGHVGYSQKKTIKYNTMTIQLIWIVIIFFTSILEKVVVFFGFFIQKNPSRGNAKDARLFSCQVVDFADIYR